MKIRTLKKLPPQYQELTYLQSNGKAYIDSGYIPNYTDGFDISFTFSIGSTSSSLRYCLLSNYNTAPNPLSLELQTNSARFWRGANITALTGALTTNINTAEFIYSNQSATCKCNGFTNTVTSTAFTGTPTASMYFFCDRSLRFSTFTGILKIYTCEIKVKNQIIKKFIPCYRISDDKEGFYDIINKTFHPNLSTTVNFTRGEEIESSFIGAISFQKSNNQRQKGSPKIPASLLPKIYQRVEYIESNGNQYVTTGLPVHMNWKYEIIFQQTASGNYRSWGAFNQSSYVGPNCSLTYVSGSPGMYVVRWENTSGQQRYISLDNIDLNKHILTINQGTMFFDGVNKGTNAGHDDNFTTTANAYLFTINPGNTTPSAILKGRIYSYKVWDNANLLKQWFIPCYRKEDNVIGFYDIINKQFYTNIGSGTFTKGDSI